MDRSRATLLPNIDTEADSLFDDSDGRGTPERNLLMAILERAILDYIGNQAKEAKEAEDWIFEAVEGNNAQSFSFSWICQQLDLDYQRAQQVITLMPKRGDNRTAPWYWTDGEQSKQSWQNAYWNRSDESAELLQAS